MSSDGSAQSLSNKKLTAKISKLNTAPRYYHLAGLGNAPGDSTNRFPHPLVILRLLDTARSIVVVRFPELGMLGITEDTVTTPSFKTHDTLLGYKSREPLYLLTFPKTKYFLYIDVWSKNGKKLLDSRPFEFDIEVDAYKSAHLALKHAPTAGMGSPTLRRRFQPTILPLSIETNPGWSATETLDSSMTYALTFRDPTHPEKLKLSLTVRPANVGTVDQGMWQRFKNDAEVSFGQRGVPTSTIGDFQIADSASRRIVKAGHEFIAKTTDSTLEYVATFLTPRTILMMLAPLDEPNQQLQVEYLQAIARSLSKP